MLKVRPVGEIFMALDGTELKVVKRDGCKGCHYQVRNGCTCESAADMENVGSCTAREEGAAFVPTGGG